jgi:hypothetical protein
MVKDVDFVMVSYDRCCVIFLVFENRETAPHHQKKQEKIFPDKTGKKEPFL